MIDIRCFFFSKGQNELGGVEREIPVRSLIDRRGTVHERPRIRKESSLSFFILGLCDLAHHWLEPLSKHVKRKCPFLPFPEEAGPDSPPFQPGHFAADQHHPH
mmetsp:Transcript_10162/g.20989  ORF Transcript_10162/g.20989 Transcript_10162/m.20989 type:complete len:103 (+) Transcript_10162:930-1238(+)